jgi:hypothetical protein
VVRAGFGPEESGVPHIKPASDKERQSFRSKLLPGLRRVFDDLAELIDNPRPGLKWRHRVGWLANKLRPSEARGTGWATGLVEALGPTDRFLILRDPNRQGEGTQ